MLRIFFACAFALLAVVPPLAAETVHISPDLTVELALPGEGWEMSREAPSFLLADMAAHLEHDLAAGGKRVEVSKLQALAARRLAANEAFVYNPRSEAVLTVDFSPLREGESPPSRRAVAASARYAGEGLADEEGVTELDQRSAKIAIAGAEYAYRIDARYRHHGQPTQFTGIVGFVSPYWFYFYYTDHLREPRDAAAMDRVLGALTLRITGG